MHIASKIDEIGLPAWIALTVGAFLWFWPVGVGVLAFLAFTGRLQAYKAEARGRWYNKNGAGGCGWRGRAAPASAATRRSTTTAPRPSAGSRTSRRNSSNISTVCARPRTSRSSTSSWPTAVARRRPSRKTSRVRRARATSRPPRADGARAVAIRTPAASRGRCCPRDILRPRQLPLLQRRHQLVGDGVHVFRLDVPLHQEPVAADLLHRLLHLPGHRVGSADQGVGVDPGRDRRAAWRSGRRSGTCAASDCMPLVLISRQRRVEVHLREIDPGQVRIRRQRALHVGAPAPSPCPAFSSSASRAFLHDERREGEHHLAMRRIAAEGRGVPVHLVAVVLHLLDIVGVAGQHDLGMLAAELAARAASRRGRRTPAGPAARAAR